MIPRLRVFLLAAAIVVGLTSSALAAAPTDLRAAKTASQQTTLLWTIGAGTDTAEYSLDGLIWTVVGPVGSGGVRLDASAVPGKAKVIGLTDFTNYYFRLANDDAGVITYSNVVDAFPPNEHAHKYFASDTNQCSQCHSTHVAVGAKLLKQATVDDTCRTCHVGTGSKYQVDAGTVDTAAVLKLVSPAGAFGTTLNPTSPKTPTSAHNLGALVNTAPGGDPTGTGAWAEPLGCGACHSAHPPRGVPGVTKVSYQYRLLRPTLPNMQQTTDTGLVTLTSLPVEAYAVTRADMEGVNYVSGLNPFCGGCHADYNTSGITGRPGQLPSGVFDSSKYRHAVGKEASFPNTVLPLENWGRVWDGTRWRGRWTDAGGTTFTGELACVTCHKAHATDTLNQDLKPDGSPNHSRLLRLDNRSVCQDCHSK